MKLIGMKSKIALISMAVVCLLMAPAFSAPWGNGAAKDKQNGKVCSMANMTPEQMGNMTLGELKEMRQQAWGNSTTCTAGKAGQNCSQMGNHTRAYGEMRGNAGKNEAIMARDFDGSRSYGPNHGQDAHGFQLLMRMDNLTVDELNNMTLNQIKDLQQKKMQELGNMTLNQIRELNQKEMQAQNNMTLNELLAKEGNMPGMGRFMDERPLPRTQSQGLMASWLRGPNPSMNAQSSVLCRKVGRTPIYSSKNDSFPFLQER